MAEHESVDRRDDIQETGAILDRESVFFNSFQVSVKREERSKSKRCAFVERLRKSPQNP